MDDNFLLDEYKDDDDLTSNRFEDGGIRGDDQNEDLTDSYDEYEYDRNDDESEDDSDTDIGESDSGVEKDADDKESDDDSHESDPESETSDVDEFGVDKLQRMSKSMNKEAKEFSSKHPVLVGAVIGIIAMIVLCVVLAVVVLAMRRVCRNRGFERLEKSDEFSSQTPIYIKKPDSSSKICDV